MKFYLILCLTFILFFSLNAKIYLPEISKKHGPLYQGIRLLILSEKLNAELAWNDTQLQIEENSAVLQKAHDYINNYERIINEKLNQLNNPEHSDEVKKCYKQYERQIARFNRDLLENYFACKQALNSSLSQLRNEIVQEIEYIHEAAIEIQELVYECNVTDLKRVDRENHHAGVTLCVLSRLGEINQHMLEASQVSLNILARLSINQEDSDQFEEMQGKTTNICLDFQYLRDEFEAIYENVMLCVKKI
ncbi:LOW QUALITY PROTEIN: uncharacterized protein LOC119610733 [Lucilia sericata]|uniref:LOW QUALITY PROTEIN: uncharacterized protein LOC119610733 n=1 Tax=Lucilia sericata TaxID=13632 RepID=UPI0018A8798A|nr:LOW QUALITY PROTEIN: uncharacterized protein LOC119610733 [Lucilia sericata]